jgi:DNA-directed RNA polymerase specialized sigma24 family protein
VRDTELSAAYDEYAAYLYAYCRFLLREPAVAVDALEAIFLLAAVPQARPADPGLLRAWLYAVARGDCLRRIRSGQAASAVDSGYDDAADGDAGRALLRAALRGLGAADRDVIGMCWHGLEVAEIAAVLGVTRDDALTLFSVARDRLELSAATLLTARAGRPDCPGLRTRLGNWDGHLTVPLARKLGQHIGHCPVCSARRRQELRPATLLGMTPGALLGAAVTGETSRRAAATVDMVRDQVLDTACDRGSKATAAREAAERRVGPFGRNGFPSALPARVGTLDALGISRRRLTVAGASIAAVIVAVAVIASVGGGQHAKTAAGGAGQAGLTGDSGAAATAGNDVRPAPDTTVSGQSATGSPSRSASPSAAARAGAPSTTPTAASPTTPAAPPSAPSSQPGVPSGSSSAPPSAKPTSASQAPASGMLGVPSSVELQPDGREWQGTLTVTVSGGSLSWSIADPDPGLRLSQSAGTSSASVEIGAFGRGFFQPLTVRAGDKSYTISITAGGGRR